MIAARHLQPPRVSLRLLTAKMTTDENDRPDRHSPTDAAPPLPSEPAADREAPTSPVASSAPLPPPPGVPQEAKRLQANRDAREGDSYFAAAARDFAESLVEMKATRKEIADGFRAQGEKIDHGNRENAQNYDALRHEFVRFRDAVTAKDNDQDARLDTVTRELATLRQQVADMQRSPLGQVYDKTLNGINGALTNIQLQLDAFASPTVIDTRELAGKTVLVVDNEAVLASTIARGLRARGATVLTAHSWAEVKDLELGKPDCVLLDLLLGADDGLEIAAWLTTERSIDKSRIILMTGQVGLTNRSGLRLVEKPFSAPEVVEAILASLSS